MAKLILLFTAVPVVELWLLVSIGNVIGFWPTLGLAIGTALLGAVLAKRQGLRVLSSWQEAMSQGRAPDEGLTGGLLVLAGAALLIVPGVLTDLVGLTLLFPPARRKIAAAVQERFGQRVTTLGGPLGAGAGGAASWSVQVIDFSGGAPFGPDAWDEHEGRTREGGPDVIDVAAEVVEERGDERQVKMLPP